MDDGDDGSQRWVDAGLEILAEGGVGAVRVEVVAQRLGVTKGGFYRRFKDRRALLDAMLAAWSFGRIAAIARQTDLDGEGPDDRLRDVVRLFVERRNVQGLSIELAIRQWARSDAAAAQAVARVDGARLANVARLYRLMGFAEADAEARGLLFYAFIFGQGLLFPDASAAERNRLIAGCEAMLAAPPGV